MKNTSDSPSPCFVLEETKLRKNLAIIDAIRQEASVEFILAFKGFAMWSAFSMMKDMIDGAAASSLNEVLLGNEHLGFQTHTYCVAYKDNDFDEIAAKSKQITFNSLHQYDRFVDRVPDDVSIGLRVNPQWSDVETDLYNPAAASSRLGIGELTSLPDKVEGLHFHVLCESNSNALEKVLDHFEKRFGHLMEHVKWVNIGGGHLVTRDDYDVPHLVLLLKEFKSKYNVDVILEPGSAFVWEAGDLHTTVLDIVENAGTSTAVIDASFTCHMPDCLEMPYRPAIRGASKSKTSNGHAYRIGGVSCLAGDFLEEYWFDNQLQVGDKIVFEDMMHYTMVKTTMFNGVQHPSIAILRSDGELEIVREFRYADYRDRIS